MAKMTMPKTRMTQQDPMGDIARTYEALLPKQFGGAVNLFIHPMAGAAAMSALGFGVASHAVGLWMGAVAGAADAQRRMLERIAESAEDAASGAAPSSRTKLELVSSNELPEAVTAMRAVAADAERVLAEVSRTAHGIADEADAEGARATEAAVAIADSMTGPSGPAKPKGIARPEIVDDLKAISGIGPKLEQVLNGLGIWTYDQIASLTQAEIAWLDEELGFVGRIGRDDWTGQASQLVAGK
jgi:NADH-quinone oxidoreductase subunit E